MKHLLNLIKITIIIIALLLSNILLSQNVAEGGIFNGYSGGMMLHTGYLGGGEVIISNDNEFINVEGIPFGIGGALRFHFGKHLRLGTEGYTSTLNYGKNNSYMTISWGGLLADLHYDFNDIVFFLGGTLGFGSMKNITILSNIPDLLTEYNAIYQKYSIMVVAPFIGMEYAISSKIRLIVKADYVFDVLSKTSAFATGPRIYTGMMFFHTK